MSFRFKLSSFWCDQITMCIALLTSTVSYIKNATSSLRWLLAKIGIKVNHNQCQKAQETTYTRTCIFVYHEISFKIILPIKKRFINCRIFASYCIMKLQTALPQPQCPTCLKSHSISGSTLHCAGWRSWPAENCWNLEQIFWHQNQLIKHWRVALFAALQLVSYVPKILLYILLTSYGCELLFVCEEPS